MRILTKQEIKFLGQLVGGVLIAEGLIKVLSQIGLSSEIMAIAGLAIALMVT